jgi:autotransporter-associated beta strand protein
MVGGQFQGANVADFSVGAVTLFTISTVPVEGVMTTQAITNTMAFRYLRYISPTNGFCNVAEVAFWGTSATPNANLQNRATNGTAVASSDNSANGQGAAQAFDGNNATKWYNYPGSGSLSPTGWLQYNFGTGVKWPVVRYDLTSGNDVPQRDPMNWQFQGSNDGTNWTTLDTETGQTFPNRQQTISYTVSNPVAFQFYRLNITANNGGSAYGIQLSELTLMAYDVNTAPTVPAVPGLTGTPGNQQAFLSWNAVSGATAYNLKRSPVSGSGYTNLVTAANITYNDTNLINGTTYYYVVTATNSVGESTNSNEVSVTPSASAGLSAIWSGAVNGNWDVGTTANWTSNGVSAVFLNAEVAQFNDTAVANTSVTVGSGVAPLSVLVNNTSKAYAFSGGAIGGSGTLTKQGSGTLTLSAANSYSGGTTLSNGTLVINQVNALGTGNLTLAGGLVQCGNVLFTNNVVVTGNASYQNTGDNQPTGHAGALSGSGTLTNVSTASSFKWVGDISGFTGTFYDKSTANMLFLGTTAGSQNGSNARWVVNNTAQFALAVSPPATFRMGELSGTGIIYGNYNSGGVITYEVGALNTSNTFSGTINNSGSGVAALTKVGTGTLTLSGANPYTGTTTVSNGELVVSTRFTGGGPFVVSDGATLGVTNAGSTAANIGTLTLGVSGPTTLEFLNVSNLTTALISATSLTLNGANTLKLTGANNLAAGDTYPLVNYSGTFSGSFGNFNVQMPAGYSGTVVSNAHQIAVSVALSSNAPAAPTGLTATPGNTQVILNWNSSAGAAGYNVKRATVSGGSYSIVATNISLLNFTNTGLSNGTLYYFVVSATNSVGESANSAEASARPVSLASPQITVTTGNGQLQLGWSADHTGWSMQAQTNPPGGGLSTNWVIIPSSNATNQMSVPIVPTNSSVFFRLTHP